MHPPETETHDIYVGPAGWSYEDWKGIVYPPDLPRATHALTFLCRYFDTVEINSSFYRQPSARNCASWVHKVEANPRFLFTAKLWQGFTHERHDWPGPAQVQDYLDGISPLSEAGRLGCVLAQFPWSFRRTADNRQWLARIADAFAEYPLAIELRHSTWDVPEVYEGFRQRNITFCNIDQPVIGDSIPPTDHVTADVAYARLHGRNYDQWFNDKSHRDQRYDYLYSPNELTEWLARFRKMQGQARQTFIVTNNHFQGQAIANAVQILAGLGRTLEDVPAEWTARYPDLDAANR